MYTVCICTNYVQYMYMYMYILCTCTCTDYVHVLYIYRLCTCTDYVHVLYIYRLCTCTVHSMYMYRLCTCTVHSMYMYILCTHVHTMQSTQTYLTLYKIVMISKGTTTMYDIMCHHVSVANILVVIATTYSEWIENSWALKY